MSRGPGWRLTALSLVRGLPVFPVASISLVTVSGCATWGAWAKLTMFPGGELWFFSLNWRVYPGMQCFHQ